MERKILILLSFILIYPLIAYSSLYRVKGMNGEYYIPDAEYDAIYINPVLLSRIDGIHILSDISMRISSEERFEDDYKNNNYSQPTNSTRTTTTKIYNVDGTVIGFLYNRDNLGFGIVMAPDSYVFREIIVTDPNSTVKDKNDTEETTEIKSGVLYNSKLLFSYSLESLSLGFEFGYDSLPYSRTYTILTNGNEDKTRREKDQSSLNGITIGLSAGFSDNKDMFLGGNIGYAILNGEEKEDTDTDVRIPLFAPTGIDNYIGTNDTYYLTGKIEGYGIKGNLLFEYRMGNDKLLRNFVDFSYTGITTIYESSEQFKKVYSASNFNKTGKTKIINIDLYTSFSKVYRNALTFVGINFEYNKQTSTSEVDWDTTKSPTMATQEYKITTETSLITNNLVLGAEGAVLDWLVLRGGAKLSLFSVRNISYFIYDAYHKKNTTDFSRRVWTFFNTMSLNAGATIKFSDNVNLDVASSFDIIGLNYSSERNEWDKTRTTFDSTKHNPVDTTDTIDFKINVGLTILL